MINKFEWTTILVVTIICLCLYSICDRACKNEEKMAIYKYGNNIEKQRINNNE